ncbi:PGF-CTERM sorting domain-containing protein [Halosolutus amylolyticus]|uniref:PGF-CTERM sorting domain-containing protein n=1 Tax=Halosolutus amylolyticus TaxID=2932267 RepID=A0ABD5PU78_9EURY|nr:PGF-CTERM sorting domain-containing protein [Halosolutus amylolyticus]
MIGQGRYSNRSAVAVAIVVLVLGVASGPVAAQEAESTKFEVTVTEDGAIDSVDIHWTITDETYADLNEATGTEDDESVADGLEAIYEDTPSIGSASVTERELNSGYELSIALSDVEQSEEDDLDVTVEDDTVVYEEIAVADPADSSTPDEITYRVVMPGEISETNADVVDGNEATWHLHETYTSDLYVESSLDGTTDDADDAVDEDETADAIDDEADDETTTVEDEESTDDADADESTDDVEGDGDQSDDSGADVTDDDSVPGFGAAVTIVAVVGSGLAVGRRTDRR